MTDVSGENLEECAVVGRLDEDRDDQSTFPAYPAYKDSGVEWLGSVPESWTMDSLKHLAWIRNGKDHKDVESPDGMYPVLGSGGQFSSADQYLYEGESVLLGRKGTIDKPLYISGRFWTVDTMFYTEVSAGASARFLYYFARTIPFDFYSTSTALPSMTQDDLLNHPVAIPNQEEQAQIARFLDHETARIDALIEEQQRLIELLKEKRQAVISHAVTKGLDPTVPMKDSGVEWLGEVPAGWDVKNMKHISSLKGRLGWQGLKAEEYREEGPFVVSSAHFNNFTIDWDACPHVSGERYDLDSNIQLCEGDVLLMKDGAALGKLAYIDHLPDRACLNSHLLLFRPLLTNQCITYISRFLFFLMRTEYFQKHITLYATGTTFAGISQEKIGNYRVALPPLEEQNAIVKFLEVEIAKFDILTTEAQRTTDLLRERRSALISAAVTGKIDVRGWQPPVNVASPASE